jgi:hypothetical protein
VPVARRGPVRRVRARVPWNWLRQVCPWTQTGG